MPGYVFDLSESITEEREFEEPSDALVVVIDSSQRIVRGVLTIETIVGRIEARASSSAVHRAVLELVEEGAILPLDEPPEDEVGRVTYHVTEETAVMQSRLGVVVVVGDEVGVRPTWRNWGRNRSLSPSVPDVVGQALQAMGSLPGFPVTKPGSRWYVCRNDHTHYLKVGSEGSRCPTCSEPLSQSD